MCNGGSYHLSPFIFDFLQVSKDKYDSSLRCTAIFACVVISLFSTESSLNPKWILNIAHRIMGFLPISVLEYDVHDKNLVNDIKEKEIKETVFHVDHHYEVRQCSSIHEREHNKLFIQETLTPASCSVSNPTIPALKTGKAFRGV